MSKAFTFRLPEELVERVDVARGDVNRTRWVQRALERALADCAPIEKRYRMPESPMAPVEKEPRGDGPKLVEPAVALPGNPSTADNGPPVRVGKPAAPSRPAFKCPIPRCEFRASSPAARCGMHGRTVVPA